MKIGRVRCFARLDFFARAKACDTTIYFSSRLSVVFIPVIKKCSFQEDLLH